MMQLIEVTVGVDFTLSWCRGRPQGCVNSLTHLLKDFTHSLETSFFKKIFFCVCVYQGSMHKHVATAIRHEANYNKVNNNKCFLSDISSMFPSVSLQTSLLPSAEPSARRSLKEKVHLKTVNQTLALGDEQKSGVTVCTT